MRRSGLSVRFLHVLPVSAQVSVERLPASVVMVSGPEFLFVIICFILEWVS